MGLFVHIFIGDEQFYDFLVEHVSQFQNSHIGQQTVSDYFGQIFTPARRFGNIREDFVGVKGLPGTQLGGEMQRKTKKEVRLPQGASQQDIQFQIFQHSNATSRSIPLPTSQEKLQSRK